jgi:hypothetical protein
MLISAMLANNNYTCRKTLVNGIITCIVVLILTRCMSDTEPADPRGVAYAGSATCIKCHGDIYKSNIHTAHFNSSRRTDASELKEKLVKSGDQYVFDKDLKVKMERLRGRYYQVSYERGKVKERHSIDITIGGVKGENYFTWNADRILQLPIAYFNARQSLTTSPGYSVESPDFSRVIPQRCLECHTSFIKESSSATQKRPVIEFEKSSLVFGIDCERCHGPAALHVQFQTENPDSVKARYITPFRSLTREQRLDLCSTCHSGNKSYMMRSIFNFKPGDSMANYKLPDVNIPGDVLDVHGNQLQLLQKSKCFINSKMDCSNCHNTHKNERSEPILFATRCITCHAEGHNYCKLSNVKNADFLKANCVKCHMPSLPSASIVVHTANGKTIPYDMTTHDINIYPDEYRKVMGMLSKDQ